LLVLWAWHLPVLYAAAERTLAVHLLEHLSLVAAGFLLWRPVVGPRRARKVPSALPPLSLAIAAGHSGLLGALLAFASAPWYASAGDTASGIGGLTDQQIAGVVLWTAATPLFVAGIWLSVASIATDPARRGQPVCSPGMQMG
jgi:cytochrome c oxidase assembly factor CtaG